MIKSQVRGLLLLLVTFLAGGAMWTVVAESQEEPSAEPVSTVMAATRVPTGLAMTATSTTTTVPVTTTSTTVPKTTTTTTVPKTTTTTVPKTTTTTVPETTTTTTVPKTTTTTTVPETTTTTTVPETTTTTTVPTEQPPSSLQMTRAEVVEIIERYFQPEDVELAAWVVRCESVYDAAAIHPSGTVVGLFQHKLTAWESRAVAAGFPGEPWWNPEANTAAAALLWYGSFGPSHHWPNCYVWALDQLD